jgi:hypothetical protein
MINKVPEDYSFVKNTRFVTEDGRQFVAVDYFKLPQGTENNPGKVLLTLQAMEQDINGELM